MRAAGSFVAHLARSGYLEHTTSVHVDLYGSLALTGPGHGTLNACMMGLEGESPESVDAQTILPRCETIRQTQTLNLGACRPIVFDWRRHMRLRTMETLPQHPNGLRFIAFGYIGKRGCDGGDMLDKRGDGGDMLDKRNDGGDMLATSDYYSIGGGFIVPGVIEFHDNAYIREDDETSKDVADASGAAPTPDVLTSRRDTAVLPFSTGNDLLWFCRAHGLTIAQVVYRNELRWRTAEDIEAGLLRLWDVMDASIENGIRAGDAFLPGTLNVQRRAPSLYKRLARVRPDPMLPSALEAFGLADGRPPPEQGSEKPAEQTSNSDGLVHSFIPKGKARKRTLPAIDWLSLYALAVNEENACGGRVVTAPTNGAAGVIPSVLKYYLVFIDPCPAKEHSHEHAIIEYLLTCAAIGMLYKRGASISAAEMGCQGEVGVACSMAAGGLASLLGGTPTQIENAAEIGMEHNLGLTCDPIGGLVQIPCIERNALGAVKAVTAAQLAMSGDGMHRVSLDQVIETMRQTGHDMMTKYKETSLVGRRHIMAQLIG